MTTLRTAAQQALEALEYRDGDGADQWKADVITALRAALAQEQAEPVAWQRIETAPKTGRKVILFYLNRNNFPRTVMARWVTDDEAVETDTDCVGLEGGWYECIDNWDDYTEVAIHEGDPTHWMPLPPAPTSEETPKKEREQMLAEQVAGIIEPQIKGDSHQTLDDAMQQPRAMAQAYESGYSAGVANEREACAKVCESRFMGDMTREDMEARRCAAAIRARGGMP